MLQLNRNPKYYQHRSFFSCCWFFFFLSLLKYIYLFLAMLGAPCFVQAFSSCDKQRILFIVMLGLSIVVASFVAEHGVQVQALVVMARRLRSCGSWVPKDRLISYGAQAQLLGSMWSLPGPGIELMSPALAGRFLSTVAPGKS